MALVDYYLCDVCEKKTFYDANLNYEDGDYNPTTGKFLPYGVGAMVVLCPECAMTHKIIIKPKGE